MLRTIKALKGNRHGVTMLEYAAIPGLVSIAVVTVLILLGGSLVSFFGGVVGSFPI